MNTGGPLTHDVKKNDEVIWPLTSLIIPQDQCNHDINTINLNIIFVKQTETCVVLLINIMIILKMINYLYNNIELILYGLATMSLFAVRVFVVEDLRSRCAINNLL